HRVCKPGKDRDDKDGAENAGLGDRVEGGMEDLCHGESGAATTLAPRGSSSWPGRADCTRRRFVDKTCGVSILRAPRVRVVSARALRGKQVQLHHVISKQKRHRPVNHDAQAPAPARHLKQVITSPYPPGEKALE